jgi:signal transduction histidine kinase
VPGELALSIDRAALDTMLRNLIDNALKACIAGNGRHIEVSAERIDNRIRLRVHDDGLGFPPEEAHLMFEKFHRLGDEQTRKTPGTGLGLYIVKRLAELSGGDVHAESAGPGHGATLTLSCPRRPAVNRRHAFSSSMTRHTWPTASARTWPPRAMRPKSPTTAPRGCARPRPLPSISRLST